MKEQSVYSWCGAVLTTFSGCVMALSACVHMARADDTGVASASADNAPPAEQWLVMDTLHGTSVGSFMEDNRLNLYGWTEGSFTTSTAGNANTPVLFQNPTNRFLMNQNWLVFERTVDTSAAEPTFGFHTAWILPGSDARYTLSRGLLDDQTDRYRVDAFHLYVEGYFPSVMKGLDVIVGKNATPVFYEVEDAALNPLFSHSYIFYYGGPFTHTGLQTKLKVSDNWTLDTRVVTGSDVWFNQAAQPTFVGSALYASTDQKDALALSIIAGSGTYDVGEEFNHYNLLDVVYSHKITDDVTYAADGVVGYERNTPDKGNASWYGAANYLTYSFDEKTTGTVRVELFEDRDGVRSGNSGLYTEATAGVSLKLRKDIIVRPEVRYDYFNNAKVYDDQRGQFTAATDLILRW